MFSRMWERAADQKATVTVDAPSGQLGLILSSSASGPTVNALRPSSPLLLDVRVGWKLIKIDGVDVGTRDAHAAAAMLDHAIDRKRVLTFIDPERLMASLINPAANHAPPPPSGTIVVHAPSGRLGLTLATSGGSPTVAGVRAASPLAHRVALGWRLLAVDGIDVSRAGHLEAIRVLTEREGAPRTLTFDAGRRARPWVGAVAHQMLYPAFLVGLIAFLVAFVQLLAPGLLAEQLERLQGRPPSASRG